MDRDDDEGTDLLVPIGDALPRIKPLTPVQRRRLESAAAIADDPPEEITFQHTVLCQTSLPYRDPGESTRVWERRQGAVFLSLEAGRLYDRTAQCLVDVGLPHGAKPRLILAHLNREALLHGSPRIEVESSLTAFIKRIVPGRSPNAREIGQFKDHLSRFAAAMVRMAVDLPDDRAYQVDTKIIDFMELWTGKDERQRVLWPAEVELSPRYYASLTKHAVPLDERALRALANSPMALDVYAWLAQRLHRVHQFRPQFIPWASLHLQFGQGFKRLRKFRETFLGVLDTVHAQYRAARVEADERGITLRYSPPPVKGRVAITPRPAAAVEYTPKPLEDAATVRRRAADRTRLRPAVSAPAASPTPGTALTRGVPWPKSLSVFWEALVARTERFRAAHRAWDEGGRKGPEPTSDITPAERFEFLYRQFEHAEEVLRIVPLTDADRREIAEKVRRILAEKALANPFGCGPPERAVVHHGTVHPCGDAHRGTHPRRSSESYRRQQVDPTQSH
jgi:hypothetical protein